MTAVASSRPVVARHLRAILVLPVMNTLLIPAAILASTGDFDASGSFDGAARRALAAIAIVALLAGVAAVASSIALFVRHGDGTLAPWDPTRRLVERGLYRHSRNPMKTGLFLVLAAESVLLQSGPLAIWAAAFIVVNVVYIRVHEEPGLRKRFGAAYAHYCTRVPRWFPRMRREGAEPAGAGR
jgi:protein-S-isoprenylcysteine O-methyltransferase Ste14